MGPERQGAGPIVTVSGPVTVDGAKPTARQRAILAGLALHGDVGATTDVLIDLVWAGRPPSAARQSLQNQVTRLRRRFGAGLIATDVDGYRLGADTDLRRFETAAVPLVDGPVHGGAVAMLSDALALWNGTPYVDLYDHVPAEAERNRLVELHALTEEHLAASRLAAGDTAMATADLSALVTADPYRERRWVLLVLAHHLAGRNADALAAYDRAVAVFEGDLHSSTSPVFALMRERIASGGSIALADLEDVAAPSVLGDADANRRARTHRRSHAPRCRRHSVRTAN